MNIKRKSTKLFAAFVLSISLYSCANDDDSIEHDSTYPKIESRNNNDSIIIINEIPEVKTFNKEKEKPQHCQGWNCVQFD